jgi:hypothetical protein
VKTKPEKDDFSLLTGILIGFFRVLPARSGFDALLTTIRLSRCEKQLTAHL